MWILRVVAVLAVVSATSGLNILDQITKGIQNDISSIKNPFDTLLIGASSSQCTLVKKILQMTYGQIDDSAQAPDTESLFLLYKDKLATTSINIRNTAEWLVQHKDELKDQRVVIFIHGFTSSADTQSFYDMSAAFIKQDNLNILALDSSSLIKWLYLRSSTYVQFIGRELGNMLAKLVDQGFDPANMHLIGHSLGAHISGFAGKTFYNKVGKKLGRISALDPAGPCFTDVNSNLRLHYNDADFVDVIHSDAGVFGLDVSVGQVDFWPNSGSMQPECGLQSCSHSRAVELYTESVANPKAFPAVSCLDWDAFKSGDCGDTIVYMGYPAKAGTTGQYFLQTDGRSPYGKGQNGTSYTKDPSIIGSLLG